MQRLLDAAGGLTRMVTLAPECDPWLAVTKQLARQGICVAAGHCNPTLDQLDAALDAGLSMFTHLGNGCPLQLHRHDNIIQRVLSRAGKLWISFIADGIHIPWLALGNYLAMTGMERDGCRDRRDQRGWPGTWPLRAWRSGAGGRCRRRNLVGRSRTSDGLCHHHAANQIQPETKAGTGRPSKSPLLTSENPRNTYWDKTDDGTRTNDSAHHWQPPPGEPYSQASY